MNKISSLQWKSLFIILVIATIGFNTTYSFIIDLFIDTRAMDNPFMDKMSPNMKFFFGVLIGPFFETLIFQFIIIELIKKVSKKDLIIILSSSILFALSHYFNIYYVLMTLTIGSVMAWYYLLLSKTNKWTAFFSVFLLHSLNNLFVFCWSIFFE